MWSLSATNTVQDLNNMIAENWDATKMNRFYTNDDIDIFDKAETGIVGYDRKYRGLFGSDKHIWDFIRHDIPQTPPLTGTNKIEFTASCKTSYQNAGIYKSVMAKMKYSSLVIQNEGDQFCMCLGNATNTIITMNANWNFDPAGPTAPKINTNFVQTLSNVSSIDHRPYSGTRRCDGFINASFTYHDKGFTTLTYRTAVVPTNNF